MRPSNGDLEKNLVVIGHTDVPPPLQFADFEIDRPENAPSWTAVGHGSAVTVMRDGVVDIRHTRTVTVNLRGEPNGPLPVKRQTSWLVVKHGDTYVHVQPTGRPDGGLHIVVAGENLAR